MKRGIGIVLACMLMLTGCINAENYALLYEIYYPQGTVTSTSMYGEEDYNLHTLDSQHIDADSEDAGVSTVRVYLNHGEQENDNAKESAVGEVGNFVMECQKADGTGQIYEYANELKGEYGNCIVLRSELAEQSGSLLVFVDEWNSKFYSAYIDDYLVRTKAYRIDINSGEILWETELGKNEFLLTADVTAEGDMLYTYKEGSVYCFTGEQFEQGNMLGEINLRDTKKKGTLVFDLQGESICIYYADTPEKMELEIERKR